ncbi:hypothetical protein EKO27_g5553 [Xylaria grammica]|uniref:Ricin B lectin domain-containing protein n=1 Tax=Xylaria grammica TaxID=363999 RepID=A0A439D546_9PEZI|nr:hypothetical protein EKO27_g5553 [Xylaria grammica]
MSDNPKPHQRAPSVSNYNDGESLGGSTTMHTPPGTTIPDDRRGNRGVPVASTPLSANGGVGSVPEPGGTYMIRDAESGRVMAIVEGRLTLVRDLGTRGGWQWRCEELPDGWIGFWDLVHRKYLGRDKRGGFHAYVSKMDSCESFVLRPREAGGYNLRVKHWYTLRAMAIREDGESPKLVEAQSTEEAARWEFVKVE